MPHEIAAGLRKYVSKEDEDITYIDIHVPYYKLNIYINDVKFPVRV